MSTSTPPTYLEPTKTGWTSEEIKARLPVTYAVIAKRAGVTVSFVSSVVWGKQKSRKVEMTIARALRVAREDIWPDRPKRKRGLRLPRPTTPQEVTA